MYVRELHEARLKLQSAINSIEVVLADPNLCHATLNHIDHAETSAQEGRELLGRVKQQMEGTSCPTT